MYSLQTEVYINEETFPIRNRGDYRMVLDCFSALNDTELTKDERLYTALIIFYEDFSSVEDIAECDKDTLQQLTDEMVKFFDGGEEAKSNTHNHKLLDWNLDSTLICSAINNVAKQEIRSLDYLHWWTFLGYYTAIGECPLSHIIGIRYKIARGEKLEKHEQKFKADNPEYFSYDMRSTEQKEADDYIRRLWGE